jgi:predicted nucleic acid-binding protein
MILINNTVLSNFALVGRLDLLSIAFESLHPITTPQVYKEFRLGVQKGLFQSADIQWLEIIKLSHKEKRHYQILKEIFGIGEASCIAVALERHITLATDDMKARKMLQQFGGIVTGTLGILVRLINDGTLSINEANAILNDMVQEDFFSPIKDLTELLKSDRK